MEIVSVEFEKQLKLIINHQTVSITPFKTQEPGNIKLGIEAPPKMSVDREEIYKLKMKTANQR